MIVAAHFILPNLYKEGISRQSPAWTYPLGTDCVPLRPTILIALKLWRACGLPQLTVPEAIDQVVIHHANRLHVSIADCTANELEAPLLQVLAHGV
jgi:hypothetical protein